MPAKYLCLSKLQSTLKSLSISLFIIFKKMIIKTTLIFILLFSGVTAVRIRELNVPALVEDGSENILLDCDYDYEENEKVQLEIKWYFNSEPTPFYQWVPEKNARPQIIGDKFRHHVDLDHVVHTDSHKRHRALLLKRPTTELSGVYTCKVSSLISEDTQRKRMIVYCK